MQKILDSLKESIGILEEEVEDGRLDLDDIKVVSSYSRNIYLSDIAKELEKISSKVIKKEEI